MAKAKKKTRKKADETPEPSWLSRLVTIDPERRGRIGRTCAKLGLASLMVAAMGFGLTRLEGFVHGLPRYADKSLRIEWVDCPDWLRLAENSHILDRLAERTGVASGDDVLDETLSRRVVSMLSDPEIGWIRSVDRVQVNPDGRILVSCQFRKPVAFVKHGKRCYIVDAEGYRLPGVYDPAMCRDSNLLVLADVAQPPPRVGHAWAGDDLAAGLRIASMLKDTAFRHQITGILLANYNGRTDRSRSHIELATDRVGARILWGRGPDDDFGTELDPQRKILLLQGIYEQYQRVDKGQAYVDIRTWPNQIAVPASMRASRSTRLLRG